MEFTRSADTLHEVTLESRILHVAWKGDVAPVGRSVPFEVGTALAGQGTNIEVALVGANDRVLSTVKGKVLSNSFLGNVAIPSDLAQGQPLRLRAKLTDCRVELESVAVHVVRPFEVYELRWDAQEAIPGQIVTLQAKTRELPDGSEVQLIVLECGEHDAHEPVTTLQARVRRQALEVQWEFRLPYPSAKVPTQAKLDPFGQRYRAPQFCFEAEFGGVRFGTGVASGRLTAKENIELRPKGAQGEALPDIPFEAILADGSKQDGRTDASGVVSLARVVPGPVALQVDAPAPKEEFEEHQPQPWLLSSVIQESAPDGECFFHSVAYFVKEDGSAHDRQASRAVREELAAHLSQAVWGKSLRELEQAKQRSENPAPADTLLSKKYRKQFDLSVDRADARNWAGSLLDLVLQMRRGLGDNGQIYGDIVLLPWAVANTYRRDVEIYDGRPGSRGTGAARAWAHPERGPAVEPVVRMVHDDRGAGHFDAVSAAEMLPPDEGGSQ
jgi:hypothetical protein